MTSGIFLQARLKSSRLDRKALLPIRNGNLLEHCMRALKNIPANIYAVLTDEQSAETLRPFTRQEGFELFAGPANDVLLRYARAAKYYGVDRIVRATGDNPLVSSKMGRAIADIHKQESADLSHFLGLPLGTGVEIIETEALLRSEIESSDPYEREHITTHMYRNRESFKVIEAAAPAAYYIPDIKISLDTKADYKLLIRIYEDIYRNVPIEIDQLCNWIRDNLMNCKEECAYDALSSIPHPC